MGESGVAASSSKNRTVSAKVDTRRTVSSVSKKVVEQTLAAKRAQSASESRAGGDSNANKAGAKGIYKSYIDKKKAEIREKASGQHLPGIALSPDGGGGHRRAANHTGAGRSGSGIVVDVLGMYQRQLDQHAAGDGMSRVDSSWSNSVTERMPSTGARMSINLALARSSKTILQMCARNLNWIEREKEETSASLYWCVTPEEVEQRILQRKPNQRVGRIPGMYVLCNKVKFAELMRAAQRLRPSSLDFLPRTVIVPLDPEQDILEILSKGYGILKPDEGTQGDGIYLVNHLDEIKRRMACIHVESAVLQSYIKRPMLLDGHKFDLRVYVVVLSLSPLRIFICHEGLVRVCSIAYELPNKANIHRSAGHLTNYTLNKTNEMFEHNDDPNDGARGTKRCLQATLSHLESHGHSKERLWSQIKEVCAETAVAMTDGVKGKIPGFDRNALWPFGVKRTAKMPGCKTRYGDEEWGEWQRDCFHILGFDIMFDQRGKAWLLEVNCNPSMAIDTLYPNTVPPELPVVGPELMAVIEEAKSLVRGRGVKECKCTQHHRPHLHLPSAIDLAAKHTCCNGALSIIHRDYAARKKSQRIRCEELVDGLRFDILVDQSHEDVIDARGDAVEHGIITSPAREMIGGAQLEHEIVGAGASSSLEGIGGSHLDTDEPAGSRSTCDDSEEEGMLGLGQVVGAMGGLDVSKTRHREARQAKSATLDVTGTRHL